MTNRQPTRLKIFFSAGDISGDLHGANLIRELQRQRPNAEFVGYGGPEMASAGCQLHEDLTALAVMWILRVILNIHKFLNLVSRADRFFQHQRPDAVVLIDYPGFNWWIARRAKAHGIPVFYYAPPQLWAWAGWRVKKMRKFVDHVLCSLPFEQEWFQSRGCNATFVGHPYFDEVRAQKLDLQFIERQRTFGGPLVTILPGSRTQELVTNLPWFLKAAASIRQKFPEARFAIACYKRYHGDMARRMVTASGLGIPVFVRKTPELIHLADCCMAVSGSVSLELLFQKKPTVVLYWVGRVAFSIQKRFRKVNYITLVNLLTADDLFPKDVTPYDPHGPGAERVLFPEYLTCEDKSEQLAIHVLHWLRNADAREGLVAELAKLKARVGHGGASRLASKHILDVLDQRSSAPSPRPHYLPEADSVSSDASDSRSRNTAA